MGSCVCCGFLMFFMGCCWFLWVFDVFWCRDVWLCVCGWVCVCMSVFDFWAYDVQLKTKLHFRGRVNNNACEQSCTTLCQLYIASAPCTLMVTMALLACVYACWQRFNHPQTYVTTSWSATLRWRVSSCLRALMIVYYLRSLYLYGNQGLSCLSIELELFKRLQSYGG